ncbi:MAG: TolC family protein [Desulfobacteraceae bacterium]
MSWKRLIVMVVVGIFLCLSILTDHGGARELKKVYTLREAVSEALANNPSFRAKLEEMEQAVQVKNQARTGFFPKLGTEYNYTRLGNTSAPVRFQNIVTTREVSADNYAWRTFLSQPLFQGFEILSQYELAKLGIDQSETEIELEKLNLALEVKVAYFDILIRDAAVNVAEKDVAARKSNADVVRSFYKVGMKPINELLQAEVEWANAQQALVQTQNNARLARSNFNKILNRPVNAPVDVKVPDPLWEPVTGELEEYIEKALANRPEMKLININLDQADQSIRLAKSDYYPEISFVGEYAKAGNTPDVSGSDFHQARDPKALLIFNWTFWEWGKTRYAVKEQESFKRQLMDTKVAIENDIRLEVREALLALNTAEKNIPTTRTAVKQGEENLRVEEERYKAQVTTITEVLLATTRLTQARVNYFGALYNHNIAKAQLLRALGEY